MHWIRTIGLMAALGALAPAVAAQDDGTTTVTVTGEGVTRDQARDDALRKAVEKGAGVVITSRTETIDHAVAFDKIVSKSEGYVAGFTEGDVKQDGTGIWQFTLTAQVALGKIKDDWGQIQLLLSQKGQPTVMVLIREVIQVKGGKTLEGSSSYAAAAIEKLLMDKGFRVKSSSGLQETERRERDAAVAQKDNAKLAAIARTYGSDIVIGGDLLCRFDRESPTHGDVMTYRYVSAAQLQAYRTDTGDVIATVDVDGYGTAFGEGEAQQRAMQQASRKVKDEVLKEILNQWYFEFQHGARYQIEIAIVADDPKDLRTAERYARKFERALRDEVQGVDEVVEESYAKEGQKAIVRYAVKARLDAKQLRGGIGDLETEGWWLEFTGGQKMSLRYTLHIGE